MNVMRLFKNHFTQQQKRKFVVLHYFVLSCVLSLTLIACSGSEDKSGKPGSAAVTKSNKNLKPHIHPENACLGARTHSHVGGDKQHEHSISCESTKVNTNAHIHPAKDGYPETRHVHPNGAREHSHR